MLSIPIDPALSLRLLQPTDAAALFALTDQNRAYLKQWLPWLNTVRQESDSLQFIQESRQKAEAKKEYHFGIWQGETLMGVIGTHAISWGNRSTSLGYWLGAAYQGQGIMTRACHALISHIFNEMGLNRIEIACATGNRGSCAIPRRLGFTLEGVRHQVEWLYDHYVDHYLFSLLAQNWPAASASPLRRDYPILEYDPSPQAIINPTDLLPSLGLSEHVVICFFREVVETLKAEHGAKQVYTLGSEMGDAPVYLLQVDGQPVILFHAAVGGSAAAAFLEELIALGGRKFIVCGGAGALDKAVTLGHLVVPTAAIRDEGTSYHYLPPDREIQPHPDAVTALVKVLQRDHVPYLLGKTWTTDAIYRETPAMVQLRRDEGCLTVEMEAAAFFAVAQFRGVTLGQILYGGDDLSSEQWDSRHWQKQTSLREKLFWLAAEACLEIP
ncbi:MAG: GNAT family N-acetyltransferase [Anaerolineae bacterium]|nr:GNAT family N-acetyltransferase [Anaerolineae bacterium]